MSIFDSIGNAFSTVEGWFKAYRHESAEARKEYIKMQCKAYNAECRPESISDEYVEETIASIFNRLFPPTQPREHI